MEGKPIYHERQSRMLCAVHALNNLFQDPSAYSKTLLDELCYELNPDAMINPHKNPIGLGNYDVNVLMAALKMRDYEVVWFDKRLTVESLELENIFGFVINKLSRMNIIGFSLPVKRPHWFAVRKVNNAFYNLDSKLSRPTCIGEDTKLKSFLTELLKNESESQILIIVDPTVSENKTWKKS